MQKLVFHPKKRKKIIRINNVEIFIIKHWPFPFLFYDDMTFYHHSKKASWFARSLIFIWQLSGKENKREKKICQHLQLIVNYGYCPPICNLKSSNRLHFWIEIESRLESFISSILHWMVIYAVSGALRNNFYIAVIASWNHLSI